MKKLLTLAALAALCAALAGCNMLPGQTGRSINITQNFRNCEIKANAMPTAELGEEMTTADTQGAASGSVFSPSGTIWTQAGGDEGGNSASQSMDIKATANLAPKSTDDALTSIAKQLLTAFGGKDGAGLSPGVIKIVKEMLEKYGYEKKAVDDCVDGLCNVKQ